MVERIRELMEYKQLSPSQFADGVEVPRAVISHILSARNKPSLEVVQKIVAAHQDVSISWLLLGEGEMLTSLAGKAAEEIIPMPENPAPEKTAPTSGDIDNIQNKAIGLETIAAAPEAGRTIEQITIFYSDKTFTTYSPST